MPYYLQYSPVDGKTYGEVTALVFNTMDNPPKCDNQITFAEMPNYDNKVVDLATQTLVDNPDNRGLS